MLNENEVIEAVCGHLQSEGYEILQRCSTTEQGTDIIAKRPNQAGRLLIEAKGGTSAREGSPRYKKGFSRSQVFDRVAKAFYTAACMSSEAHGEDTVALALPDTMQFREFVARMKAAVDALQIRIYLVKGNRFVVAL